MITELTPGCCHSLPLRGAQSEVTKDGRRGADTSPQAVLRVQTSKLVTEVWRAGQEAVVGIRALLPGLKGVTQLGTRLSSGIGSGRSSVWGSARGSARGWADGLGTGSVSPPDLARLGTQLSSGLGVKYLTSEQGWNFGRFLVLLGSRR